MPQKPTPEQEMKKMNETRRKLEPLIAASKAEAAKVNKEGFADLARKRAITRAERTRGDAG